MVNEKVPTTPLAEARLSADELLSAVELLLSEKLVSQVGACFQFHIALRDGTHKTYFLDLSKGKISGLTCHFLLAFMGNWLQIEVLP